jgi:hypothetical protein
MPETQLQVRETAEGLEVRVHVQPRAGRRGIAGVFNGALKVKVTAPPVDDAANRAVVELFADLLGIPKSACRILYGEKSRDKTLLIRGISIQDFLKRTHAL